jgi:lipopolysaccharide transport system ATP-binding protein
VKHYSSGMYVRLAFSVSAWLDPDILILDEVLAVGDQAFQRKCAERMRELTREGRTVIVVSHSMATVNQMCQKALYLERGRVVSFDAVEEATIEYQRDVIQEIEQHQVGGWHRSRVNMPDPRIELLIERTGEAEFISASIRVSDECPVDILPIDSSLRVEMRYRLLRDLPFPVVPNFHLYDEFGGRLLVTMPNQLPPSAAGEYIATCVLPAYELNVGRFMLMVALSSFTEQPQVHFAALETLRFEITEEGIEDPRRHGFRLPLPGFSRARLDWTCQTTDS